MTRQERLEKAGFEVFWANWGDTEFYIEDGTNLNLYLNFYNDNENVPKVDVFVITEPNEFDPEAFFDVVNGVPDITLVEDELWNRVKEGWLI